MIVAGNRDSGGNRAPELVNLVPDIFAAERILVVLDAVFRDDNGLSVRPGPAERVREGIRLVREESGIAERGPRREAHRQIQVRREPDLLAGVIVEPEEIESVPGGGGTNSQRAIRKASFREDVDKRTVENEIGRAHV